MQRTVPEVAQPPATRTVRDEALAVLRDRGLTTMFANPGSTEVGFLVDLPSDFAFVLALHEASVVGLATGWALARDRPALVLLHTTAGLGNAVGTLATARVNRAPLVVIVGQQDRRHLAFEPFLAGRLDGLAGDYPVSCEQPTRPQDVAGALERACHAATTERGPALVIVPMDDWLAPADASRERAAAAELVAARGASPAVADRIAMLLGAARSPAVVAGAGAGDPSAWAALVELADRLAAPVWQEPFGARAGFPQDHRRFAGHLPADREGVREALAGHDVVLVVGAAAFRQYPYRSGKLLPPGTSIVVVTDDPAEAYRSPADLAVVAEPGPVCAAVVRRLGARDGTLRAALSAPTAPLPAPAGGDPLQPGHVFDALAARLPPDAIVVEESPSSRAELHQRLPARSPLGFVSAAMGGLGFGLPAAIGLRMGAPSRPVVAVLGDGSTLFAPQALWSAVHYHVGVLAIVLRNGGYAIMDRLARREGGAHPWPAIDEVDIVGLAGAFGCPAVRIEDHHHLLAVLDDVLPHLAARSEPLLIEIPVAP